MKIKLIYLLICILLLPACGELSEGGGIGSDFRILSIRVQDDRGYALADKIVYIFSDEFPSTYTNAMFSGDNSLDSFEEEDSVASAITDEDGYILVSFAKNRYTTVGDVLINYEEALNHKYYFIVFDENHKPYGFDFFLKVREHSSSISKPIILPSNNKPALKFSDVSVTPNVDGNMSISFCVNNRGKIQSLYICDKNRAIVEDLSGQGNYDYNFDDRVFAFSSEMPIDNYYIYAQTIDNLTAEFPLGENIDYIVGNHQSEEGAYLSIFDNKSYTMENAVVNKVDVMSVSSDDGRVYGLKAAEKAHNVTVAENARKVLLIQDGYQVSEVRENGIIITENGCICKINSITNDNNDAIINMFTIKNSEKITISLSDNLFQ